MTVQTPQTATIVDNLSEGFRAINRRPWLALLPFLLSLFLWFGPQLSFAPLTLDAAQMLDQLPAATDEELRQIQYQQLILWGHQNMWEPLARLNYVPMFAYYSIGGMSSETTAEFPLPQQIPSMLSSSRDRLVVSNGWEALLIFVGINIFTTILSGIYLTMAAAGVRGDRANLALTLRRSGYTTLAILGFTLLVLGVGLLFGLPFFFIIALLLQFSPSFGILLVGLLWIIAFWVLIYIGFAPEAIAISGIGPIRAMHASFNIVRRNFWATLGILIISWVISSGIGVIWLMISGSTWGMVLAIIGSAYIGTALVAARMAYYRERLRRWQAATAPVRKATS